MYELYHSSLEVSSCVSAIHFWEQEILRDWDQYIGLHENAAGIGISTEGLLAKQEEEKKSHLLELELTEI